MFVRPFLVIVVALSHFHPTPETAALCGTAVVIVCGLAFGYRGERLNFPELVDTIVTSGYGVLDLLLIRAAAGVVMGVINRTGLGFGLALMPVNFGAGNL